VPVLTGTLEIDMNRLRSITNALTTAGRLGWAIESNWTDPFIFITYQVVRPLFGAFILVFMFKVVTGQPTTDLLFAQLYVGNAFFILVIQAMTGVGQVVFEDREHYEMIRYIYLAPIGLGTYLTGRGLSKIIATTAAVGLTLLAGYFLFGISLQPTVGGLPYLAVAMVLGIVAMMALGIMLAAITLVTAHHGFGIAEGASGVLFLLCGAVFTVDILPRWVVAIAHVVPLTYWLEGIRRVLLGTPFIESLATLSNNQILWRLTWTTGITVVAAGVLLWGAERLALSTGKLDLKTDH
jgi:ABC-2 type transport system permease protein